MFSKFLKKKSNFELSLAFDSKGMHLCAKNLANGELTLGYIESTIDDRNKNLLKFVEANNYQHSDSRICLSLEDYLLVQIDKPDVSEAEINEAVKWKLGDLIPWDLLTITVDTFETPQGGYAQSDNINAVVVKDEVVQNLVDLCEFSQIVISKVEIAELSLSRLFPKEGEIPNTVATMHFYENKGLICLYHEQTLFLTRRIELGTNIFSGEEPDLQEQGVYERIALDLQRSLDYFESTFNVGAINQLFLLPEGDKTSYFADYLKQNLSLQLLSSSGKENEWSELIHGLNSDSKSVALCAVAGLM